MDVVVVEIGDSVRDIPSCEGERAGRYKQRRPHFGSCI
jgi:hypothetical protein